MTRSANLTLCAPFYMRSQPGQDIATTHMLVAAKLRTGGETGLSTLEVSSIVRHCGDHAMPSRGWAGLMLPAVSSRHADFRLEANAGPPSESRMRCGVARTQLEGGGWMAHIYGHLLGGLVTTYPYGHGPRQR